MDTQEIDLAVVERRRSWRDGTVFLIFSDSLRSAHGQIISKKSGIVLIFDTSHIKESLRGDAPHIVQNGKVLFIPAVAAYCLKNSGPWLNIGSAPLVEVCPLPVLHITAGATSVLCLNLVETSRSRIATDCEILTYPIAFGWFHGTVEKEIDNYVHGAGGLEVEETRLHCVERTRLPNRDDLIARISEKIEQIRKCR